MTRSRSILAGGALLPLLAPVAHGAAEATPQLERLVVVGERISPTAPGETLAREELAHVPGGASIVAVDDYADGRASTLAEVFALTPGVFAQSRFGAEEARLSIRGSGLQRTFHMRGITLLQDGVPITLADGSSDFQAIEPLALAYTEVLRGANAMQYGGVSLGGSVNFVSPTGREAPGFRPRLDAGSFGYRRVAATLGTSSSRGDVFLSASGYEQQGFRSWSEQKSLRFFSNAGWRITDAVETRFYVTALDTDSQLPGALTRARLRADPRPANPANLAGRQKRDFQLYRIANRTATTLGSGTLEAFASVSVKDLWHPIFQVLDQRSTDGAAGVRYVGEMATGALAHRVTIGATPSWNRVHDERFVNQAGRAGARTAGSTQRSGNLAFHAQDELQVTPAVAVMVGSQWTQASRRYADRFLSNGDQGLDVTYTQWSPKVGVLWTPRSSVQAYANVSDSFEPPSFGELAGGPGVDLLRAQRARTVELGSRGDAGPLRWDVSAYTARVHGELLGLNDALGQPLGTVNAPRTVHRGIELAAEVRLSAAVRWTSAYLLNDFRFDGNAAYGNNRIPGVPRQFYRGELRWTPWPSLGVSLTTEISPDRQPVDMANTLFASGYAVWGLKVSRQVDTGLSWHVETRNLGDRSYAATTGVIADARGLDAAQFFPGDGRAVYAGISWKPNAP